MTEPEAIFETYRGAVRHLFARSRRQVEEAVAQLTDEELHHTPGPESNSVAVMMKHIAGNQLSRWTDFLTTDGEKVWRNRDEEFVDDIRSRADLLARWEQGWAALQAALDALGPDDLLRTVRIRGRPITVLHSIEQQVQHYGYHAGQIAYLARMLKGAAWKTLSIPRDGSDAHNQRLGYQPE